tara:strand:+ start:946 stop:1368 length:423 start_codon:yes stop_codon:yes gene_type:complete
MSKDIKNKNHIIRDNLINYLYNCCDKSKISNRTLGTWIKSIHYTSPLVALATVICCNNILSTMSIIFVTIVTILAIYFKGCFLSILEYKLTDNKYDNITNIILEIINWEINQNNQIKITYIFYSFYIPIICCIYFYRFII